MNKKIKEIIKYIVIIAILIGSLYLVLDDVNLKEFINILSQVRWEWCLLSVPVAILSHWVRAIRWKIFLKPILDAKSNMNLFSAVMVGYFVNNVIPRGGEFVRPFVYARRENVSKSAVLATIVTERIIDVIFLMLMFAFAYIASKDTIMQAFPWISGQGMTYSIILLVACIAFIILLLSTQVFDKILYAIGKKIMPNQYEKLKNILDSFRKGLEIMKAPSSYLPTFIYSLLIWALYALPMYLMFFAFDFQSTLHLGLIDAGLLIVVSGVGTSIAPTPGAIGVYHWIIVSALVNLYPNISQEEALAYATLTHGVNLIIQVIIGAIFLLKENITKIPTKEDFEAN
ncbi:MAG: flippase-like domain-containing protein [Bacteroidetes bacterium]|nr:flippase-like domain-containing protein [Bacteroidota bacterium]